MQVPDGFRVELVAAADLDQDQDIDLVIGNVQQANSVYLNQDAGRTFQSIPFGDPQGNTYGLAVGDLTGDGKPDIVTANSGSPNRIFLNRFGRQSDR